MVYFVLISSFIALFVVCQGVLDDSKFPRVKRVINGKPVLQMNSEYRSVQFFVSIAYGHSGLTKCGGALLTSTVVQTACHCVAEFVTPKRGYMEAKLDNVWEDFAVMYPGALRLKSVRGVLPNTYIKHPKCRKGESRRTYHDYGLVILSKSMRGTKDTFAPVYTMSTLADLFVLTQAKSAVCLIVGFGRFLLTQDKTPASAHPKELLHGWVRAVSYHQCYNISYLPEPGLEDTKWNYTEDATWMCAKNFTKYGQYPSFGDSGGPIVCNNQHVGLGSAIHYQATAFDFRYLVLMSTVFSIFENSAEYRLVFNKLLEESDYASMISKIPDRPCMPTIQQYHIIARNNRDHLFPNFVLMITFAVHLILSYSYPSAVSLT